jgi:hypothetical protein
MGRPHILVKRKKKGRWSHPWRKRFALPYAHIGGGSACRERTGLPHTALSIDGTLGRDQRSRTLIHTGEGETRAQYRERSALPHAHSLRAEPRKVDLHQIGRDQRSRTLIHQFPTLRTGTSGEISAPARSFTRSSRGASGEISAPARSFTWSCGTPARAPTCRERSALPHAHSPRGGGYPHFMRPNLTRTSGEDQRSRTLIHVGELDHPVSGEISAPARSFTR